MNARSETFRNLRVPAEPHRAREATYPSAGLTPGARPRGCRQPKPRRVGPTAQTTARTVRPVVRRAGARVIACVEDVVERPAAPTSTRPSRVSGAQPLRMAAPPDGPRSPRRSSAGHLPAWRGSGGGRRLSLSRPRCVGSVARASARHRRRPARSRLPGARLDTGVAPRRHPGLLRSRPTTSTVWRS